MIYRVFFFMMLLVVFGIYKFFSSSKTDNTLSKVLSQNPVILDVRSTSEFKMGHINGAINLPLDRMAITPLTLFDPHRPVITYCSHGVRSIQAVQILKSRGLKDVYNGGAFQDLVNRMEAKATISK